MKNLERQLERLILDLEELEEESNYFHGCEKLKEAIGILRTIYRLND